MNAVERAFRDDWNRVLATMVGYLGDLDLAEEVTQEAFAIATERWPRDGNPAHPTAWLITTARNRAINRVRRDRTLANKAHLLSDLEPSGADDTDLQTGERFPDERLELMFLCCHPALAIDAQVALTLKALGGLTTGDIARSFLVTEATMAQRIVRAKRKIAAAGIPFRIPRHDLLAERTAAVSAVIYLIFNQGYSQRSQLAEDAIRLGTLITDLLAEDPEVHGLLALMLLLDARADARFRDGELVMLADQDVSLLDDERVADGRRVLDRALELGGRGPYVLQAAIASLHAEESRDWPQIVALYGELARATGSAVVELSRAIAVAEIDGPEAALTIIDQLDLDEYHYLHAARAEMFRRLGRVEEAAEAYRRALTLVEDDTEGRHLQRRLQSLT